MLSDYRHWLEYDSVALAVLLVGIGLPLLFYCAHLVTEVRTDGIDVRALGQPVAVEHRLAAGGRGDDDVLVLAAISGRGTGVTSQPHSSLISAAKRLRRSSLGA